MRNILLCSLFVLLIGITGSAKPVHHYVFFGMDREKLKAATTFLEMKNFEGARKLRVGVGGPDLLPYKRWQMESSYPLIRASSSEVAVGVAVQDGNYAHVNPRTGKQVTINEIIKFGKEYLGVDYIFWCTEEPYYSEQLVPFLKRGK